MSQTATQDEDILIISDDTTSADSDIFLEESVDSSPSDEQETPIKLSISTQAESSPEGEMIITDEGDMKTTEIPLDLDISFDNNQEDSQTPETSEIEVSFDTSAETPTEQKAEITTNEFDFSNLNNESTIAAASEEISEISDTIEETTPESLPTPEIAIAQVEEVVNDGSNLNEILAGTIAKLVKRQEVIASDKAAKTSQIQDLKTQIVNLEEEVALHEAEVEILDVEDDKIGKNITQLEKMKLGDEEVTKEHNAKRIPKK